VTHRGVAASFTVVTGHRQPGGGDTDWEALAQVGGTIVVLMGVAERGVIAARLMAGGLPASTPVVAIRGATRPDEEIGRGRLDELARLAIEPPATIVIGAVAALDVTAPAALAAAFA
jgi:siroheme synthase